VARRERSRDISSYLDLPRHTQFDQTEGAKRCPLAGLDGRATEMIDLAKLNLLPQ
jgi:hypothetical protein